MIHVCINSIANLCNFILLFLPFCYIYLYNFFFYKTTLCKNSVWFSAKESKLSSGLSQTPYNGFVITSEKNPTHSESIAQAMHQYKSLTGTTAFKTISFDVLKTFRENSVKYIFFKVPTRPAMKNNTFRIRFFILFDLGQNFCFI